MQKVAGSMFMSMSVFVSLSVSVSLLMSLSLSVSMSMSTYRWYDNNIVEFQGRMRQRGKLKGLSIKRVWVFQLKLSALLPLRDTIEWFHYQTNPSRWTGDFKLCQFKVGGGGDLVRPQPSGLALIYVHTALLYLYICKLQATRLSCCLGFWKSTIFGAQIFSIKRIIYFLFSRDCSCFLQRRFWISQW